jgi:hypothetical protein
MSPQIERSVIFAVFGSAGKHTMFDYDYLIVGSGFGGSVSRAGSPRRATKWR